MAININTNIKSYLWTGGICFAAGFILCLILSLKGCFSGTTFTKDSQDSLQVNTAPTSQELDALPLSAKGDNIVTRWRTIRDSILVNKTDTIFKEKFVGGDCKDFEHNDTVKLNQKITVVDDGNRTDFDVQSSFHMRQFVGCSAGKSLLELGPSQSEIVMPERKQPISQSSIPLLQLKGFGKYNVFQKNDWEAGVRLQMNIDRTDVDAALKFDDDGEHGLDVGFGYELWRTK